MASNDRESHPSNESKQGAKGEGKGGHEHLKELLEKPPTAGRQLPASLAKMSSTLGGDLSDVRIHDDPQSAAMVRSLGAQGFTHGRNIFVVEGASEDVLAHEVAHAAQHHGGDPDVANVELGGSSSSEDFADRAAAARHVPGAMNVEVPKEGARVRFKDSGGVDVVGVIAKEMGTDEGKAKQMLRNANAEGRGSVEAAVRRNFDADKAKELITAVPPGAGQPTPEVKGKDAKPEKKEDGKKDAHGKDDKKGAHGKDDHKGEKKGGEHGGEHGGGHEGGEHHGGVAEKVGDFKGVSTEDLNLIHQELIEHEEWQSAMNHVGTAGSDERAGFIAEQAGKGTVTGFTTGLIIGGATGLVTKLAERFVPIPGVGAIIAGGMSAYGLATKDWKESGETIAKFGEGSDTYEQLANTIAAVSEIIDIIVNVMNVIAGIIGIISAAMWIITICTLGAASPLAATLSAIALGIVAVSSVIDEVNKLCLQPLVLLFRAMHTFQSEADPRDVEKQGVGISKAAEGAASILGAKTGAKVGEKIGGIGAKPGAHGGEHGGGDEGGDPGGGKHGGHEEPAGNKHEPEGNKHEPEGNKHEPEGNKHEPEGNKHEPEGNKHEPENKKGDEHEKAASEKKSKEELKKDAQEKIAKAKHEKEEALEKMREVREENKKLKKEIAKERTTEPERAANEAKKAETKKIEAERKAAREQAEAEMKAKLREIEENAKTSKDAMEKAQQQRDMAAKNAAHEQRLADIKANGEQHVADIKAAGDKALGAMAENKANFDAHSRSPELESKAKITDQAHEAALKEIEKIEDPKIRDEVRGQENLDYATRKAEIAQQEKAVFDDAKAKFDEQASAIEAQRKADLEAAQARHDQAETASQAEHDAKVKASEQQTADARAAHDADVKAQQDKAHADEKAAKSAADEKAKAEKAEKVPEASREAAAKKNEELDEKWKEAKEKGREASKEYNEKNNEYAEAKGEHGNLRQRRSNGEADFGGIRDNVMAPVREGIYGKEYSLPEGPELEDEEKEHEGGEHGGEHHAPEGEHHGGGAEHAEKATPAGHGKAKKGWLGQKAADFSHGYEEASEEGGYGEGKSSRFMLVPEKKGPKYNAPPGDPKQLEALKAKIIDDLEVRAKAEADENAMQQQEAKAKGDIPRLTALQKAAKDGTQASKAHEEAVKRKDAANKAQKERNEQGANNFQNNAQRMAGIAQLSVPLAAFSGFTWIGAKVGIPGFQKMNDDAVKFGKALAQMKNAMSKGQADNAAKKGPIAADGAKIQQSAQQGAQNSAKLQGNEGKVGTLKGENDGKVSEAGAAKAEAKNVKGQREASANKGKSDYAQLAGSLKSWAVEHKAARQEANAQSKELKEKPSDAKFGSDLQDPSNMGDFPTSPADGPQYA